MESFSHGGSYNATECSNEGKMFHMVTHATKQSTVMKGECFIWWLIYHNIVQ